MPLPDRTPEEVAFQRWYADWARRTGINPNPDDPRHFYDWRAAYRAGATPVIDPEDKRYHWPSTFKTEGHPRLIIEGIDTRTGKPVSRRDDYESLMERSVTGSRKFTRAEINRGYRRL